MTDGEFLRLLETALAESSNADVIGSLRARLYAVADSVDEQAATIARLTAERDELRERVSDLEVAAGNQTYRGNSISYIYDKMTCKSDQLVTCCKMLKILGIPYGETGRDNIERSVNGPEAARKKAEEVARLTAENERLRDESGLVKFITDKGLAEEYLRQMHAKAALAARSGEVADG